MNWQDTRGGLTAATACPAFLEIALNPLDVLGVRLKGASVDVDIDAEIHCAAALSWLNNPLMILALVFPSPESQHDSSKYSSHK